MKKEEIHLIQEDIIYTSTIITDLEIKATVTIQKTTFTNIITMLKITPKTLNL